MDKTVGPDYTPAFYRIIQRKKR